MRCVAEEWVLKNPVPVGDPGLTVEFGESMFARHKYNRGRVLLQAWVVGGLCCETGRCFLARVAEGHDGLRAVHAGGAVSENRDIVPRVNSP
uniref:Uncharacterized protein n=1 Tax=Trichuris muris TaxID=70415 RepID=A0A5S6QK91_TRIMR